MDKQKLQEVFSDKAYVESIMKMSAEDAAKSLCEKGVEVTAQQLIEFRDFVVAHKEELQNGELSEESLAAVAGGLSDDATIYLTMSGLISVTAAIGATALLMISCW